MSILQHNHKKTGKLTKKTWDEVELKKMGELLAKNIGRTTRIQLDGQHPLFGEHLQNY